MWFARMAALGLEVVSDWQEAVHLPAYLGEESRPRLW
jgi:hypothetical protein